MLESSDSSIELCAGTRKERLNICVTAIIRPASLRFKDLVEEIEEYSSKVDRIAAASAQAELRVCTKPKMPHRLQSMD